ncbi:MAG: nucleotide disphospho-sugar-binding domain-containing protein [Planctomycetota bacterium]
MGTGFCCPPNVDSLPNWRPWLNVPVEHLIAADELLCANINRSLSPNLAIERIGQLYQQVDHRFLMTYLELDHFPYRDCARFLGCFPESPGAPPRWPEAGNGRLFAYLKPAPGIRNVVESLAQLAMSTLLVCPGLDSEATRSIEQTHPHVALSGLLDVQATLDECDLAVHHGSHGLTSSCLLAGVPSVMLPLALEQRITAVNVHQFGGGRIANPSQIAILGKELREVRDNPCYRNAAASFGARYRSIDRQEVLSKMASVIAGDSTDVMANPPVSPLDSEAAPNTLVDRTVQPNTLRDAGLRPAIFVLGSWRGGTSLVAGILRSLGVFIGNRFVEAKTGYPTYEDLALRQACLACFDETTEGWGYRGTKEDRINRLRQWLEPAKTLANVARYVAVGGKHPVMCKLIDELEAAWATLTGSSPIYVSVERTIEDIFRSWDRPAAADGSAWWPRDDRDQAVRDLLTSRDEALSNREHVVVNFEELRRDPRAVISELADVCHLPLDEIENAISLVKPR